MDKQRKRTVLITGGSGLLGSRLRELLEEAGYQAVILSRGPSKPPYSYHWNTDEGVIEHAALERSAHIIHLAGAGIADERWSRDRKEEILKSRVHSANALFDYCREWQISPLSFISASAIGIYGDTGEVPVTEEHRAGSGFLSEVCQKWEDAADQFGRLGARVAKLRIGIVLAREAGMLPKTLLPLKAGLAPYFGSGRQFYSWVHIDDVCRGFIHLLQNEELSGAFNMTGGEAVSNKEYMQTLKKVTGKRALSFGLPPLALRLLLGEMSEVLLMSNRVSSEKIRKSGFVFHFEQLTPALEDLLKAVN